MAVGHPARTGSDYVQVWRVGGGGDLEHRVIVARVLGHPIPAGVEIHHVNGDRRDNRHSNLVVCQDKAYHKLLHVRARIKAAGGNPNTDAVCGRCGQAKPLEAFSRTKLKKSTGRQSVCKPCHEMYRRERKARAA
jgi:hypothetical protein